MRSCPVGFTRPAALTGHGAADPLVSSRLTAQPHPLQRANSGGVVSEQRDVLRSVSTEMVRLYKEHFGRGPTRARSAWAGPHVLVSTLEETMTPAEEHLVEMGEHQRLRDTRMFFQYATEHAFREAVERIVGRPTRAFVSGMDTRNDISTEVFYFHPEGESRTPTRPERDQVPPASPTSIANQTCVVPSRTPHFTVSVSTM